MKSMDIDDKLRLLNGKDFRTTRRNLQSGIREIVFSDGTAGLRFQPGKNDHPGLTALLNCLIKNSKNRGD